MSLSLCANPTNRAWQILTRCTALLVLLLPNAAWATDDILIPQGGVWKYLDDGSNQGTGWRNLAYDDTNWRSGQAILGYGPNSQIKTVVSYGPNANNKYITTYFRASFNVLNPSIYTGLTLSLKRDDGAIVYLNGTEVMRTNMPAGAVDYTTRASSDASDNGTTFFTQTLPSSLLAEGSNVIAVEIHQSTKTSGDIIFDLGLNATVGSLSTSGGQRVLIGEGSSWKYLDDGSSQTPTWRQPSFNDVSWMAGDAILGYGPSKSVLTTVGYGPDPNNKYITTYFRRTFNVDNAALFQSLIVRLKRDDGAVVYLNGSEILRDNMPTGSIASSTLASTSASDNGTSWQEAVVTPSALLTGTNVLAVEVHQDCRCSSDIIFDFQLIGSDPNLPGTVTRGPYLQSGTSSGTVVRWRTDNPTESYVHYGSGPGSLTQLAGNPTLTTEHEVAVTGLLPSTRYFYSVGTATEWLAGGNTDFYFVTSPPDTDTGPFRMWVLGDSGTAGQAGSGDGARAVRNAFRRYANGASPDLWLMLGDNAYNAGLDTEYQAAVYDTYPWMLRNSVLWPALGNHDTDQSRTPPPNLPYFSMFTLPTNAEAGGVPSGTEKYYSFNYANAHVVVLDSQSNDRLTGGAMLTWLANDLAATTQRWLFAIWHHPVYSKGNHDSDTEIESVQMRDNAARLLEDFGVDLVLNGHSHDYERSFFIDGHYGTSTTFVDSMKVQPGDGHIDGTGAYVKAAPARGAHDGAVYIVDGGSGTPVTSIGSHPAILTSNVLGGSLVIDISDNRLDARYLTTAGDIADYFTILKGVAPPAPTGLAASATARDAITLTWVDSSRLEDGFRIERSTDGVTYTEVAVVGANVTTFHDSNLEWSTTYWYRVRAYDAGGTSPYSDPASATTLSGSLNAPTDVTATVLSSSEIQVNWQRTTDARRYRVERATAPGGPWVAVVTTPALDTTDAGLASGTTFYYHVIAINGTVESPPSSAASAATFGGAPAAPSNLGAVATSASQIRLSWTDNATNEDSFQIERSLDGATFTPLATVGANLTVYVDGGLTADSTYIYRVRAHNAAGNSTYTAPASATTTLTAPTAPTSLGAVANSTSQITVTWTDTSANEDSFQIERAVDGTTFIPLATVAANITAYPDAGLSPGTSYSYRVRAHNAAGDSAYAGPVSATTIPAAPAAPTNVSAIANSASQITLTWADTATNEDSFEIERALDGTPFSPLATVATNVTTYVDAGLTADTTYTYRVRAHNSGGDSVYSPSASATTPMSAPTAPTNLSAAADSSSQITLTWSDTSANEDRFDIERSIDGTTFAPAATAGANVTNYVDSGLAAGTTYTYRVRAHNAGGDSAYSATASAATMPAAPAPPANLTAVADSSSQITLTWTDAATNETSFQVERASDGTTFVLVASLGANVTTYSDPGLTAATTYTYRVRARNSGGDSAYSNTAFATTAPTAPNSPNMLTATANSSSQITLNWRDNATNEIGVRIERSLDGVTFSELAGVGANVTSYVDMGLASKTRYTYRVRAFNTGGFSGYSGNASATTLVAPPATPTALTAVATSTTQINLAWVDNATNETGVKIEQSLDGVTFTQIAVAPAGSTSRSVTKLTAGTTYYFRVRSTNAGGDSAYSNTASAATLLNTPTNLTASATTTSVTLLWVDNATNESGYRIERSLDGVTFAVIGTTAVNGTTFTDSGLLRTTAYFYRVQAFTADGNTSVYSKTIQIKTK